MPSQEFKSHFSLFGATAGGFATVVASATGANGALVAGTGVMVFSCLLLLHGADSMVDEGRMAEAGVQQLVAKLLHCH